VAGSAPVTGLAGAEYFQRIQRLESNRRVRSVFHDLVQRLAPPGARLFDFGAGPGIDARYFAERSFTVDAYDVDPKMCEFFRTHCRDFIASGRITLTGGDYREFLAREAPEPGRRADLVVSNFAPLNQVSDLNELFAKFHTLTAANGQVLASVLTPCFIADMKSAWWWRNAPGLWLNGHFFVSDGPAPPHTRRRLADFGRRSLPYFRLTQVFPGLPPNRRLHSAGIAVRGGAVSAYLRLARSQFMFLLFEKRN
jgi:SAM-dependent methyltransferase